MSSVVISGDVSGSVTLQAPSAAGTTVLTLPATSGTVVTTATSTGISGSAITTGTVGVSVGGTGANTLTANNVILGNGTSAVQFVAPGSNGNLLTSNGTTWTSAAAPSSTPTTAQVLSATAGATAGAVGTYALLYPNSNSEGYDTPFGSTRSGSILQPTNAANFQLGTAQSGTWRTMGQAWANDGPRGVTVFLRIS